MKTDREKYKTIVIDPPWPGPGEVPAFNGKEAVRLLIPYATMSGIQIAALPIGQKATKDAQLFIWATARGLGDAYLLMQTWGFRYRGLFVWMKNLGLGRHIRNQTEFLVWGAMRGAKQKEQREAAPRQVHEWPQRGHSEKPAEAYALIKKLTDGPRLDIFARTAHDGFEPWGNEVGERDAERFPAIERAPANGQ